MTFEASLEYLCAGGNRHPSAADCDPDTGLACFGAGKNLAIWSLHESANRRERHPDYIIALLSGHEDTINAAKFASLERCHPVILTGAVDTTIRLWQPQSDGIRDFYCSATIKKHKGSVNCITILNKHDLVASGAADATVKLWKLVSKDDLLHLNLLQDIDLRPKYFPLALSIQSLGTEYSAILAVGGTRSNIDVYVSSQDGSFSSFEWKTSLLGHEGWVRSLDFVQDPLGLDHLLASASQDKYIRLWRIHPNVTSNGIERPNPLASPSPSFLSNKSHIIRTGAVTFALTFEALLLGHEDWIYSVRWNKHCKSLQLLSASADNSLVIWEPDLVSGIWICRDRLGEVSVQKGSTTATGSTGGFWVGLWSSRGSDILGLGRTGTWRKWSHNNVTEEWIQKHAVGGHTRDVRDIDWTPSGSYLLSVSADQTTRVHAKSLDANGTWFELARPQIHGYDMNCVGAIDERQFVSGADEKLLRVFDAPRPFANSLHELSGMLIDTGPNTPHVASVPVLGLSNRAGPSEEANGADTEERAEDDRQNSSDQIPNEDTLSRHTLWPEREKLYGHGFEIACLAVSHDGTVIATACKASSLEHAVIRLYDTDTWQIVVPPLAAHSLTVTCLAFSEDDMYLLSGGRDRQWAIFWRESPTLLNYAPYSSNPKGHSRMILGAAWISGLQGSAFGTAGRDKCVKLWSKQDTEYTCLTVIAAEAGVTSIDFNSGGSQGIVLLACGLESGAMIIHTINSETLNIIKSFALENSLSPSLSINRIKWQPLGPVETAANGNPTHVKRLAIASQDASVRIVKVTVL